MKTRRFLWVFFMVLSFIVLCSMLSFGQSTQAEVPGDDFSLEGALELFKKSASPEEFERSLNSADAKVNNLDLNGDGNTDYIKVIDQNEGNVHAFILQAVISENESQDVAVIELEKLDNGKAVLQIIGDADVYGTETIIEPTSEVRVNAGTSTARTVVNVWAWPSVQYVYSPYYVGWISPWRWSLRPVWYRPWRPVAYYTYSPWWQPYRPYYAISYTHRIGYAQRMYRPIRTTSVIVYNRHHDQIAQYRSNYSRRNRQGYDNGHDSRNSSYANRNDNHRPAMNNRNTTAPSGGASAQPDWRNNHGSSPDQHQGNPNNRTSSFNGTNHPNNSVGHRSTSDSQMPGLSQRGMPGRFQGTSRTDGSTGNFESRVQRTQPAAPAGNFRGRQNTGSFQPGRGQQNNSSSPNHAVGRRGR